MAAAEGGAGRGGGQRRMNCGSAHSYPEASEAELLSRCPPVDTRKRRLMPERDSTKPVYANVVEVTVGPYDIVLDFGFKPPESQKRQSTEYENVARVAMSLGHAKSMLPVLAKMIAQYEQHVGPITAPGFEDMSKE